MDLKSKIILISGPTASGKSSFAIKLAKKVNGEIINADSMQVYKQLKILSARPDQKKYQKIKHHLYGFHDVKKNFSTGNWLKLVFKKIEENNITSPKTDCDKFILTTLSSLPSNKPSSENDIDDPNLIMFKETAKKENIVNIMRSASMQKKSKFEDLLKNTNSKKNQIKIMCTRSSFL